MVRHEEWLDTGPVVRPYAVTGGRTQPKGAALELVALVATTRQGIAVARDLPPTMPPEWRDIAHLCQRLQSVAEISALLDLPLGVAQVLVADMAQAGLVSVQRPARPADRPSSALLRKVLDGLQRL
ncbi:DUF742 domain-containing protein [Frankia sp. CNm7]|uniref:DUF742 domain-containing protein n=1 Tax=Frankia nepalensis TaxID=1836974 RepID=A0A937RIV4_9ACTN|nr:DUF742 domain-containing protein [Frankia nepalensis]MBL7494969.1 DUF742 domain-containing protein [Frankia nepalensis]MBL7514592.1 DUF742 domain-containing protein [Frankia nepalensis]MBL7523828.1 DUF742 domain-containing protein [Frankia nepalensis]MBL7633081.1 DUF742 domain-containing protein [Frankia nepalensis]